MLNHVEYPSSVKEGTETPGAFDQNGQRFYVLDRLQEQASRIRYLLDTTVFFRDQLEACQAAGNAEAAQSTYLSLSSGRIGIANGVRSLKPLLLELEHPAASICEALVDQISSFELMTRDYSKFSGVISRFLDALPSYHTVDASTIGRLMNHVKLGHYPTDLTHVGYLERGIAFPDKTVNLLDPCCGTGDAVLRLALGHDSRCYGIELDEERAGLAEQKLFRVAYGDFFSSYVGNRSFHTILLTLRQMEQIQEVVITLDMDKLMNWRVQNALTKIIALVRSIRGIKIRVMNWNMTFKGIDDFYLARNYAAKQGVNILDMSSNFITIYLEDLWKREYPKQDRGFIHTCEWEELTLPVNELTADPPKDMRKAKNYLRLLQEGTADFPPLVCVNRMVIDGQHRFWAYRQAGFQQVKVYQNKPWAMPAAA